ncbi:MAG: hypothetical protein NC831_07685 [Candidatus Omnitrophica bacterium]|nr:hypothetical protein [Candidatus Omnitrophota bacterium]
MNNRTVETDAIEGTKTVASCLGAVISSEENRNINIKEKLFSKFDGL